MIKASIEFQNCVSAAQGSSGLDYDTAFRKVSRERPDLVKKMKRSAFNDPAWAVHFVNSNSPLGAALASGVPPQIAATLKIGAGDNDSSVIGKLQDAHKSLNKSQIADLWQWIVNRVRCENCYASDGVAAGNASKLFPELSAAARA